MIAIDELEILALTEDYLVVNKPPGIAVQGTKNSLLSQLKSHLDSDELYPTHRLDLVTSGCVIFARNVSTNQLMSKAFQERRVSKYYLALSDKKPNKKQGPIFGDMSKSRNGCYKLMHSKKDPARTAFFSVSIGDGIRLYIMRLYTGKTHQARVALKAIGAPILGDQQYGGSAADRVYLHSYSLVMPLHGEMLRFQCSPVRGEFFQSPNLAKALSDVEDLEALPWSS